MFFLYLFFSPHLTGLEKKRVGVVVWLFLLSAVFWSGFEQAGSSMNLFARDLTNRSIAGWLMPASWLQNVNAIFIILLAPVFGWLWTGLAARKANPATPVKFALGLFEHPYTDEHRESSGALPAGSVELARAAAERSFVLLKNDAINGRPILPLAKDVQTVALIGPLGDDAGNMLGSWAGRGRAQDAVTLRSALTERLGAEHVKYAKGGDIQEGFGEQIDEAVAAANAADVVIMALGEDAGTMTAEAASSARFVKPSIATPPSIARMSNAKPRSPLRAGNAPSSVATHPKHRAKTQLRCYITLKIGIQTDGKIPSYGSSR